MGLCVASPIALPRKKSKSKSLSSRKLKTFFLSFLKKINSSVSEAEDHMEKEKEESLRLAIAVSLLRSKIQNRLSSSSTSLCDAPSETDPLRWKQKNRRSSSSTSRCGAPPSETDALRWKQKVPSRIRFCVLGFK